MNINKCKKRTNAALCALLIGAWGSVGWTQSGADSNVGGGASSSSAETSGASNSRSGDAGSTSGSAADSGSSSGSSSASGSAKASGDTVEQIRNATQVVKQMESDPQVQKLLQQAKGVFIVPQYGRGGLGIGARGGEGVFLANNGGKWSNPVFYNIGGVSLGAQAGAEVGAIAMMLMNDKAVRSFTQENKFSLTADAGLTIVNYTAKARAATGKGDVVVWSDTAGAFANATVGITDVNYDDDENAAFYKSKIAAKDIVAGRVTSKEAAALTQELSSGQ
ncbi:hypothetical protein GCM10027343_36140 [Noviherbaspirillum agri]